MPGSQTTRGRCSAPAIICAFRDICGQMPWKDNRKPPVRNAPGAGIQETLKPLERYLATSDSPATPPLSELRARLKEFSSLLRALPPLAETESARLVWRDENGAVRACPLGSAGGVVGRGADCTVRLSSPRVSARHFSVRRDDDTWLVEDLRSTNGTRINGTGVSGLAPLQPGDRIEAGGMAVFFDANPESPP